MPYLKDCLEAKAKAFSRQRWKMLLILILTSLLFKESMSQITGYGNTTAAYGGDVYYSCAVANPTGVLQVTWQRLFKDESLENLATYSKRFGQQVNEPYREKVIFTEASLTSTSITLTNVTWEDESCYICSFNVYPGGSKRKQICLTVQGISDVTTHVHPPTGGHEGEDVMLVFSCSATGKPAPSIQWTVSPGATRLEQPQTVTVTNSEHMYTSSRNITLKVPPDWNGHVDCLLNSGVTGERQERIPFSLHDGHKKKEEEGNGLSSPVIALVVIAVVFISSILVAAAIKRKRLKDIGRASSV